MRIDKLLEGIRMSYEGDATDLSQYTVYFDMDGVLADLAGAVNTFVDAPDRMWSKPSVVVEAAKKWFISQHGEEALNKNSDFSGFWESFEPLHDGFVVWKYVTERCKNIKILTAIQRQLGDHAKAGKLKWCAKHLGVGEHDIIFSAHGRKSDVLGDDASKSILIDDLIDNTDQWDDDGGKGVLFRNSKSAISELDNIGRKAKLEYDMESDKPGDIPTMGSTRFKSGYMFNMNDIEYSMYNRTTKVRINDQPRDVEIISPFRRSVITKCPKCGASNEVVYAKLGDAEKCKCGQLYIPTETLDQRILQHLKVGSIDIVKEEAFLSRFGRMVVTYLGGYEYGKRKKMTPTPKFLPDIIIYPNSKTGDVTLPKKIAMEIGYGLDSYLHHDTKLVPAAKNAWDKISWDVRDGFQQKNSDSEVTWTFDLAEATAKIKNISDEFGEVKVKKLDKFLRMHIVDLFVLPAGLDFSGKNVLVVDDYSTFGSSAKSLAKSAYDIGAVEVKSVVLMLL